MTTFTPTSAAEVLDTVAWAVSEEAPLEILGHGSKRGIGRPAQTEHTIDLSQLTGVTLYEPEELVLSARAGTPLAEIEALLAENRQELAFEPMDYGPLLGDAEGRGTIGGTLAANLSGPRRLKAGAARDHVLGINAVSGRGEAFKSGGRVVKNVTGYDLSKGLAGSWGTLAVATDVTFKVLPAAETETTIALRGMTEEQAAFAMAAAMGSSAEVSGAAHLPETVTGKVIEGALKGMASTLLRVEGFGPSVDYRVESLKNMLSSQGEIDTLACDTSRLLWREIRDCRPYSTAPGKPLWRVSMTPSQGHAMVMALRMRMAADVFYDWQGGLIWIQMEVEPGAELLRGLIAAHGGGHATLVRATPSVRAAVPVFQPQPAALAALSARLKEQFDPHNILNPGRMAG
ncbi:MAG: glycolate oxidase subunit GlcE [Rhizobiaceae bacterium]